MNNEVYIKTNEQLHEFCQQIKNASFLAVDTEFMREKTYYPQLCLIQIASESHIACIDPLSLQNLEPLWQILFDEKITKIFHAARQDLELIYNITKGIPKPIFDTQIAATLLGLGDQISYATLVKSLLDTELDKSQTRTDWNQRPLEAEQIHYAANDVRYLIQCYPIIIDKLSVSNRSNWLDDDFSQLADIQLYNIDMQNAWLKVSGKQKIKGNALGILQSLAAWRERTAQQKDLPKKWVMKDDVLIGLAMKRPNNQAQLAKIRGLNKESIDRIGDKILSLINANDHSNPETPNFPLRLSQDQDALVDSLMSVMRLRAFEENISPSMIANRKDIEKILALSDYSDLPIYQGWRKEVAGDSIIAFLNGDLKLTAVDGKLTILK